MCDPHLRLRRLLTAQAGPGARLLADECAPWRSATFTGARHRFVFRLPPGDAHPLDGVDEADLAMPGHLLAEIGCTTRPDPAGAVAEIAAVTLEAA